MFARRSIAIALFVAALCGASAARAGDRPPGASDSALEISVDGYDSWSDAVEALQADVHAEGQTLSVSVSTLDGTRMLCDGYRLTLDAVARQAFELGPCDIASATTPLRLVHRDALFSRGDFVPQPLPAGISVEARLVGSVTSDARPLAESTVTCSVAVHPFMRDLEHGLQVPLIPGRFVLHPLSTDFTAVGVADGWTVSGSASGTVSVEYEVTDTSTERVVLRDRATLVCAREALATPRHSVHSPIPLAPHAVVLLTTNIFGITHLSLANVSFGGVPASQAPSRGRILGEWMLGWSSVGVALETRGIFASAQFGAAAGDHVALASAHADLAFGYPLGRVYLHAGLGGDLWNAVVWGSSQQSGTSGWNTDLGIGGGIRIRAGQRRPPGIRTFRISELTLSVFGPVLGNGPVTLTLGAAWGAGR